MATGVNSVPLYDLSLKFWKTQHLCMKGHILTLLLGGVVQATNTASKNKMRTQAGLKSASLGATANKT